MPTHESDRDTAGYHHNMIIVNVGFIILPLTINMFGIEI